MTALADSHCHIAHVDGDPSEIIADARDAGVELIVDIGMGTEESTAAAERAASIDGVYATAGLHPNDLGEYRDGGLPRIRELLARPGVVGVGETGLDFYRDREPQDVQEASFRDHIALAKELDRTLVIHCRDAHRQVLDVLDDAGAPDRVIMHCFSGDASYARECVDRGFFCSFAGNVTFKKASELREATQVVPDPLLLVETDAPYLTPHPYRGKPNRPALVVHTAQALAELRGVPEDGLFETVTANTRRVFAIHA